MSRFIYISSTLTISLLCGVYGIDGPQIGIDPAGVLSNIDDMVRAAGGLENIPGMPSTTIPNIDVSSLTTEEIATKTEGPPSGEPSIFFTLSKGVLGKKLFDQQNEEGIKSQVADDIRNLIRITSQSHERDDDYVEKNDKNGKDKKKEKKNPKVIDEYSPLPNINTLENAQGEGVLHVSAISEWNGVDIFKILIEEFGAEVDKITRGEYRRTPLMWLLWNTGLEKEFVVKYLVKEKGADINLKAEDGKSAVDMANDLKQFTLAKQMIQWHEEWKNRGKKVKDEL